MNLVSRLRQWVADAIAPESDDGLTAPLTVEPPHDVIEDVVENYAADMYRSVVEPDDPDTQHFNFNPFSNLANDVSDAIRANTDEEIGRIQRVEIDVNYGVGRVIHSGGPDTGCTCDEGDACDECGGDE